DSGQVAGAFEGHAAIFDAGAQRDLGALPGHAVSAARAINASGLVVGESAAAAGAAPRAFLWDGGMHALGALPGDVASQARAINGGGLIVGWSRAADGTSRAFVWYRGVMYDLNDVLRPNSGWVLTSAAAINERAEVAGVGLHDGQPR